MVEIGHNSAQIWPKSAPVWSQSAKFGRAQPQFGRDQPQSGRTRPNLVEHSASLSGISTNNWRSPSKSGQTLLVRGLNLVEPRPHSEVPKVCKLAGCCKALSRFVMIPSRITCVWPGGQNRRGAELGMHPGQNHSGHTLPVRNRGTHSPSCVHPCTNLILSMQHSAETCFPGGRRRRPKYSIKHCPPRRSPREYSKQKTQTVLPGVFCVE